MKKVQKSIYRWLRERKLRDLVREKRRLVEVTYTATLADAVNSLVANRVIAVPVAAPPGRFIGAGGSMIVECDSTTGVVRKQYIGIITMLDVLVHIAEGDLSTSDANADAVDLDSKMAVRVSSLIGHSLEGLSLWTLNPNTSILDCMEAFSKGVHRALVPIESQTESAVTAELVEASPGYRMLTQMDVLSFLRENGSELKDVMSRSVGELNAVHENVFAVTNLVKVIDAVKSMRTLSLTAVPIVAAETGEAQGDEHIVQDGRGRRLIETFSATDLRVCSVPQLRSLLSVSVMEFKDREPKKGKVVTCGYATTLGQVIDEAVVEHVHRVWVVDEQGMLRGLVSLSDMLRVIRENAAAEEEELQEN
ncbi:hypothetical protein HPP92_016981 [Vanilla planifolia]|uniref:CBS domain-containing protein n=1 Tax=Vanilla planifolia TaxID=51239 RepID=A0A835QG73_VANPL|nr:hypothetical protein HPP92_016981 [Vanilla planifolia]